MDCNLFSSEFYCIPFSLLFLSLFLSFFSLSFPLRRELNQMIDTMRRRDGDHHKCSSHSTNEQMVEVGSNQRLDSSRVRKKGSGLKKDESSPRKKGRMESELKKDESSSLRKKGRMESELKKDESPSWPRPIFDLFNLVPSVKNPRKLEWKVVGNVTRQDGAVINTIQLSPSTIHSPSSGGSKHRFRVVTGIAPPFVQESTRLENGSCLTGVPCLRVRLLHVYFLLIPLHFSEFLPFSLNLFFYFFILFFFEFLLFIFSFLSLFL